MGITRLLFTSLSLSLVWLNLTLSFFLCFYFERQWIIGRMRLRETDFPSTCFFQLVVHLPNAAAARTDPGQIWDLGTPSGYPTWWQGPKLLSCHLLPTRVHISRKLELGTEQRFKLKYSNMRCGDSMWHLNYHNYAIIIFFSQSYNSLLNHNISWIYLEELVNCGKSWTKFWHQSNTPIIIIMKRWIIKF